MIFRGADFLDYADSGKRRRHLLLSKRGYSPQDFGWNNMNEPLPAALERFKRKERNLLVQAMLGHNEEKPLQLADSFLHKIAGALDDLKSIPADAWWATDYHISWLAGALAVLVKVNRWYSIGRMINRCCPRGPIRR
jgi:hypothetical protein